MPDRPVVFRSTRRKIPGSIFPDTFMLISGDTHTHENAMRRFSYSPQCAGTWHGQRMKIPAVFPEIIMTGGFPAARRDDY